MECFVLIFGNEFRDVDGLDIVQDICAHDRLLVGLKEGGFVSVFTINRAHDLKLLLTCL